MRTCPVVGRRCRCVIALAIGVLVAPVGCTGGATQAGPGVRATSPVDPSPAATSAEPPVSPTPTLPRGGRTLLPSRRIVAYYGAAGSPGMGVLGTGSPDEVWPRLAKAADRYARPGEPVLPAYELIAVIASRNPGKDGKYRRRVAGKAIDRYLAATRRHDALLILDIQPGQGDFLTEAKRLAPWLAEPNVGLALDPEWRMASGERPGDVIGSVTAKEINAVSAWLSELTRRHRLPQKLLMVHQFTDHMVRHEDDVRARDNLAIVFNMDGFGSPAAKISRYRALAEETDLPLGFKLFYHQDTNLLGPGRVLDLDPAPRVIEYQ